MSTRINQRADAASDYERAHESAAQAANASVRAFNARGNLQERYAQSHGLCRSGFEVLLWLYYADTPLTQRTIVDHTLLNKQTVNMAIAPWRKLGYVEAVAPTDPNADGRQRYLALTESGRAWAREILDPLRDAEIRAMQTLSENERGQLIELANRYVTALRTQLQETAQQS